MGAIFEMVPLKQNHREKSLHYLSSPEAVT